MSFTVPTYIRTQDTEKYNEIISKGRGAWTEFIHNALNPKMSIREIATMGATKNPEALLEALEPIKTPEKVFEEEVASGQMCKHGSHPKFCKYAKFDKTRKQKWCS